MTNATKGAIYSILGNAYVIDDELHIGAYRICLIHNHRLTKTFTFERIFLLPNHLLLGLGTVKSNPQAVESTDYNSKMRWRQIQELIKYTWKHWIKEWLL